MLTDKTTNGLRKKEENKERRRKIKRNGLHRMDCGVESRGLKLLGLSNAGQGIAGTATSARQTSGNTIPT